MNEIREELISMLKAVRDKDIDHKMKTGDYTFSLRERRKIAELIGGYDENGEIRCRD